MSRNTHTAVCGRRFYAEVLSSLADSPSSPVVAGAASAMERPADDNVVGRSTARSRTIDGNPRRLLGTPMRVRFEVSDNAFVTWSVLMKTAACSSSFLTHARSGCGARWADYYARNRGGR